MILSSEFYKYLYLVTTWEGILCYRYIYIKDIWNYNDVQSQNDIFYNSSKKFVRQLHLWSSLKLWVGITNNFRSLIITRKRYTLRLFPTNNVLFFCILIIKIWQNTTITKYITKYYLRLRLFMFFLWLNIFIIFF